MLGFLLCVNPQAAAMQIRKVLSVPEGADPPSSNGLQCGLVDRESCGVHSQYELHKQH